MIFFELHDEEQNSCISNDNLHKLSSRDDDEHISVAIFLMFSSAASENRSESQKL